MVNLGVLTDPSTITNLSNLSHNNLSLSKHNFLISDPIFIILQQYVQHNEVHSVTLTIPCYFDKFISIHVSIIIYRMN